jgi:tRNA (guanine-N7-)-methyltransferase
VSSRLIVCWAALRAARQILPGPYRLVPGGVLRIATDISAYAAHARAQLAHHGRWAVVEGERPDWRPDDGFEAKGVRAGRTVTELTCTLNAT